MPSFVDAVVVTVACGLGTLVGKALSRPSGRSMEDLAWGIDLAVAAIAIQVSILANPLRVRASPGSGAWQVSS